MDYIQKSTENPPPYYLPYGSQCATWAFKALTEAGIPALASPNMFPDDFLRDLFETIIWNPYTQWLNLTLRDLFTRAKRWTRPRDPIILDLDGDGLETVGLASNVYFDFDGDGVLTKTGWAGAKTTRCWFGTETETAASTPAPNSSATSRCFRMAPSPRMVLQPSPPSIQTATA
jgi:hypothetical protein